MKECAAELRWYVNCLARQSWQTELTLTKTVITFTGFWPILLNTSQTCNDCFNFLDLFALGYIPNFFHFALAFSSCNSRSRLGLFHHIDRYGPALPLPGYRGIGS